MTTGRMKMPRPDSLIWYHLLIKKEDKDVVLPDYHNLKLHAEISSRDQRLYQCGPG